MHPGWGFYGVFPWFQAWAKSQGGWDAGNAASETTAKREIWGEYSQGALLENARKRAPGSCLSTQPSSSPRSPSSWPPPLNKLAPKGGRGSPNLFFLGAQARAASSQARRPGTDTGTGRLASGGGSCGLSIRLLEISLFPRRREMLGRGVSGGKCRDTSEKQGRREGGKGQRVRTNGRKEIRKVLPSCGSAGGKAAAER